MRRPHRVKSSMFQTSSATAEIARDADDVDFSVDDVHSTLTLAHPSQTDGTDEPVTQGHSLLCQSTRHI